jgi:hypothetical protein
MMSFVTLGSCVRRRTAGRGLLAPYPTRFTSPAKAEVQLEERR